MAKFSPTGPILDASKLYIAIDDQATEETYYENISFSDESGITNHQGANRVIGSTRSAGGASISLTLRVAQNAGERIDYETLRDDDIVFVLQYLEGYAQGNDFIPSLQSDYTNARVASVNKSHNADGSISLDVTIMATGVKRTTF